MTITATHPNDKTLIIDLVELVKKTMTTLGVTYDVALNDIHKDMSIPSHIYIQTHTELVRQGMNKIKLKVIQGGLS